MKSILREIIAPLLALAITTVLTAADIICARR
jgi:hypothetical protein